MSPANEGGVYSATTIVIGTSRTNPDESLTRSVVENDPASVGVPVMAPVSRLRVSPGGSGMTILQWWQRLPLRDAPAPADYGVSL